jgi:hypothetical protein
MRAGIRVALAAATWGFLFVAAVHVHLAPEQSVAPVVGALLWLLACAAIARAGPRGQARRLVVTTAAVTLALLTASAVELIADDVLVPEIVAAVAFLATVQCFAATMAEVTNDLRLGAESASWDRTGRFLVVLDVASVVVAVAWVRDVVERRADGAFRVSDVDLAPVGTFGRVVLGAFVTLAVVAAAHFFVSVWRTWAWARRTDEASAPS